MELVEQLINLLNKNKVIFVVIGAYALPVHGYTRATGDIDVFIKPTPQNAEKTLKALKEFGYDVTDITVKSLLGKKLLVRGYMLDTDIHPFVKGINFKNIWKDKVKSKIYTVECWFASFKDMIKMKKAANRVKDKEDLKYLVEILKLKKKRKK